MPQLFACPSGSQTIPTSGLTPYQVFAGEGALLDLTKKVSFAKITDGTSNTIMAIEAESLVTWTKPDDIDNDAVLKNNSSGLQGAGSKHPNGVNALFADGSVRFLKTSISRNVMKALISRAGGEIVGSDSY
jgi:prepilin-type processing-associated H-X9-DG protein